MGNTVADGDRPDKLSFRTKLGWGLGGFCENLTANGFAALALPIYNIGLGISPVVIGWITFFPRFLDAIFDIWIGHVSDNCRSRWGRRRPFIFAGAVLCGLSFMLLWMPPRQFGDVVIMAWFAVISIGYWLAFGLFSIPYNALGYELSPDYNERTNVQAYRFVVITLSAFCIAWLYKLCFWEPFAGPAVEGLKREVIGVRWVGLIFGVAILLAGIMPAILGRERPVAAGQAEIPLWRAIRMTFSERIFLHFIAMIVISIFGVVISGPLQIYVAIYHIYHGAGAAKESAATLMGVAATAGSIAGLVGGFVVPPITRWIGKKGSILLGQGLLLSSGVLSWWCFNPAWPYLTLAPLILMNAGMSFFQILYGSFLGDICDIDELKHGARREGMYGAVSTFLNKIIYSSVSALNGYILAWTGFKATLAVQAPETLLAMRGVLAFAPVLFAVLGAVLAIRFPLTARKACEVRAQLDARRKE